MKLDNKITFCISTYNNLNYLKIAIDSVRKNSYFINAPLIVHAENCTDGTDDWLEENKDLYNIEFYIDKNDIPIGIGGGMNFCANKVITEYIMFLHSDMYVSRNWDINLLNLLETNLEYNWAFSYRIEPNIFGNTVSRHGTFIVEPEYFGMYYYDFNSVAFDSYALEFMELNKDYIIPKAEGVSGLIRKSDWDFIGGNDPIFAPASWEDMDLFLRMKQNGYKFALSGQSVVWHFGARGSHRLEENDGKSSDRQIESEIRNKNKWLQKWGGLPVFDEYGMISGVKC